MSAWGNDDNITIAGTVAVVEDSREVTGSGTDFTDVLKPGNALRFTASGVQIAIAAVISDTELLLKAPWTDSTASGLAVTGSTKPTADTTQPLVDVLGVDINEAAATAGVRTPGWVRRKDLGNGRIVWETLVAMKEGPSDSPTDEDVLNDAYIVIETQPVDAAEDEGDPASFSVVAVTVPDGIDLNYQWQTLNGDTWENLSNGEDFTGVTTDTLTVVEVDEFDGDSFRVEISSGDITKVMVPVTSDPVTLTVIPDEG